MAVNLRQTPGRVQSNQDDTAISEYTSTTTESVYVIPNEESKIRKIIKSGSITEESLGKGSTFFPAGNQKAIKGQPPVQTRLNPETTKQFEDKKILLAEIQELSDKVARLEQANTECLTDNVFGETTSELEQELDELREKLNKQFEENKIVSQKLENSQRIISELEELLKNSEQKKNKYYTEVKTLKELNQKLFKSEDDRSEHVQKIKSQNAVLSHKLQEVEQKYTSLDGSVKAKGKEYKEFMDKLKSANELFYRQNGQMKDAIKQQENTISDMQKERDKLQEKVEEQQMQRNDTESSIKSKARESIAHLQNENQEQVKQIKELMARLEEHQRQSKDSESHIKGKAKESITHLQQEIQQLSVEKRELQQQILQSNQQVTGLKGQLEELNERLSEKNNKDMSTDNNTQAREVVSITNRLSDIAGQYKALCTNEWLYITEELDELCKETSDEDRQRFLCKVMLEAENGASMKYDELLKGISKILSEPISVLNDMQSRNNSRRTVATNIQKCTVMSTKNNKDRDTLINGDSDTSDSESSQERVKERESADGGQNTEDLIMHFEVEKEVSENGELCRVTKIPEQVQQYVEECIRLMAGEIDVENLIQDIIRKVNRKKSKALVMKVKDNTCFHKYVGGCLSLAWSMVAQRPRMSFSIKGIGKTWNGGYQDLSHTGEDPHHPTSVVEYYLHPVLMNEDTVMVKGRVLTRRRKSLPDE